MADDGADEKEARLKALLESISTLDPALRVLGVVKTPDVEGRPSRDGKALPGGVKGPEPPPPLQESELPPPLLGEPREVRLLRPALIPFEITKGQPPKMQPPMYLDNPEIGKKKAKAKAKAKREEYYRALLQIPWLHTSIRTAIRKHELGQTVDSNNLATSKLQTSIFEEDINRYKAAGISLEAACEEFSRRTGISVEALKKRLQPNRRGRGRKKRLHPKR